MVINSINGVNSQLGGINTMQTNDSVSKNIQNQIANAQKQLQDLSSNKDMSIEEKMKKRQEIQQQITDLNNQLRQHQVEQRKEKQAKKASMDNMVSGNKSKGSSQSGMNASTMRAMISADSAMAQAQVQGSVASKMEGRGGVLEAEIKLDMALGGDVEKKQEELAEVTQKATRAEAAQLNTLADASKELEAAAKADKQTEKTDDMDKKTDKKDEATATKDNKMAEAVNTDITEAVETSLSESAIYSHVDVRL